jgi:hypothetical protein
MLVFYEGQSMIDPATFVSNFNHSFALVQPQLVDGEVRYKYVTHARTHAYNTTDEKGALT